MIRAVAMGTFMIKVYHAGYVEIPVPDIKRGRVNADFGQGFYLSNNEEFSKRWARERKGINTYLNRYELDLTGLQVKYLSRDEEWFQYIYHNRSGGVDYRKEHDVIIGPIANDTIYDTFGILTAGVLTPDQALEALKIGSEYQQIVLKTEAAAMNLRFLDALILSHEEITSYRGLVEKEEAEFQELFSKKVSQLLEE